MALKKVLVVSHERSGTHFLINTIGLNFRLYRPDDISIHTKDGDPDGVREQYQSYMGKWEPRIFKSHHQFAYFEPIWEDIVREFEVFYMVRDPRGVFVSSWFYHKNICMDAFPRGRSFRDWLKTDPTEYTFDTIYSLDKSKDMIERWIKHVDAWLSVPEVRVITYSELSNDFEGTLHDRLAYMLPCPPLQTTTKPVLGVHKSVAPRCGVAGEWKKHVSKDDNSLIIREVLLRLNATKQAIVFKA